MQKKNIAGNNPKIDISSLKPSYVVWETTLLCNMNCIHCGSNASTASKRPDELSTEEALNVIHQLAELGTEKIVLSGGEPFLRKDWDILAKETALVGIIPSFISNGFILNKEIVRKIRLIREKLHPRTHVGISIDGSEDAHDYIRQRKGSYQRATKAIQLLQDSGIPVSVITQVNKLNLKHLYTIRDNIFSYGIYAWQLQMATPWGRLRLENKKLVLSPREYLSLVEFIAEQKKILGEKIGAADGIGYYTYLEPILREQEWSGCFAGLSVMGITSNGGIMGCLSLQDPDFIEGNIRQKKLKDIWYDPLAFSYNRNFKEQDLRGYCKQCHHRLKCRAGCKNTAYSGTGSLFENLYCAFRVMVEQRKEGE